jgi:hypothetical protein
VLEAGVRDLVLFDLALDYGSATRLAIARADTCGDAAYASAAGALQAAGVALSRLDDVAGLAVLRIVAMLANEAADAVVQGVAGAEAIDTAMQKGVNYPRGRSRGPTRSASAPCATRLNCRAHGETATASRRWSAARRDGDASG